MHARAHEVQEVLDSLGVRGAVRELPSSTRSAQEAAEAVGTTAAQIAKSLVFASGPDLILIIASGGNQVSTDKVGAHLGTELTRPDAKTVKKRTGFSIGGVPPVGHAEKPTTVVDEDLLAHSEVWAAAGTPNAVFPIAPDDLVRITRGQVLEVKA